MRERERKRERDTPTNMRRFCTSASLGTEETCLYATLDESLGLEGKEESRSGERREREGERGRGNRVCVKPF